MTIKTGDMLPSAKVMLATAEGPREVTTDALFRGKRAVLFAVPGAFTPTCSEKHVPGYIQLAGQFASRGIDRIVCLSVNDAFVLKAWAAQTGADGVITMLADGAAVFTHELGLELDLTSRAMGIRAQRFAMILDDMKISYLAIEPPGGYGVSSAEQMLAHA